MLSPLDALDRLRQGNRRFVAGEHDHAALTGPQLRAAQVRGQQPFAAILGCSDSRVPLELVFDQGLGDLFVIRVAGNIAAPSQIGSIEYAVANLGTRLVVVLGHACCGAVGATLDILLREAQEPEGPNLPTIVDAIKPALQPMLEGREEALRGGDRESLLQEAVRANVRASIRGLREGSPLLCHRLEDQALEVVGAEHDLGSGVVHFLDPEGP